MKKQNHNSAKKPDLSLSHVQWRCKQSKPLHAPCFDLAALDQTRKVDNTFDAKRGVRGSSRHVTRARLFVYKFRYSPRTANGRPVAIVSPVRGHTRPPARTDLSWPVLSAPYPFPVARCDGKNARTAHHNTRQLFWKLVHYTLPWTPRAVSVLYQHWWMTSVTRVARSATGGVGERRRLFFF